MSALQPGSVFVATLSWSRATYVEFVTDERVESLIDADPPGSLCSSHSGSPRAGALISLGANAGCGYLLGDCQPCPPKRLSQAP
jgi:hypothetical protein